MKDCCRETFKEAYEEVLLLINTVNLTDINMLVKTLKRAIVMLEEKENDSK